MKTTSKTKIIKCGSLKNKDDINDEDDLNNEDNLQNVDM